MAKKGVKTEGRWANPGGIISSVTSCNHLYCHVCDVHVEACADKDNSRSRVNPQLGLFKLVEGLDDTEKFFERFCSAIAIA
jgi:hypothetical protein